MRLLFLAHRLPWPPDKGERIRAFHFLRHLATRFAVTVTAPCDEGDVAAARAALEDLGCRVVTARLGTLRRTLRIARALAGGEPVSLRVFRDPHITRALRRADRFDLAFAVSTAAAELLPAPTRLPLVLDMVDVDSAKWEELAARSRDPLRRAVLRREAELVRAAEREWARRARRVLFAAERERDLFAAREPDLAARARTVSNGVDLAHFDPAHPRPDPCGPRTVPRLLFVGRMDYPPNVEAAVRLARSILPRLLAAGSEVELHIVGAAPTLAVRRLAGGRVRVWGRVADTRPFLAHADAVAVPLAVARGIQNKLLEAMAMGRPVVASPQAAEGLPPAVRAGLRVAEDDDGFAAALLRLLTHPEEARSLGLRARALAKAHLGWERALSRLDAVLDEALAELRSAAPPPTPAARWPAR
ncbi:Phosphatidyl-myo-inositol mannosyltransferase [bacterium HR39]|nr:Phosphatidyl-myo-inositol mannosyltransferase [bacterium HR39]